MNTTATTEISEARKKLNSIDARLKQERIIVVTRHGRGVFAIVDLETLAAILKALETLANPEAMESLRAQVAQLPPPISIAPGPRSEGEGP